MTGPPELTPSRQGHPFGGADWALLTAVALMWGTSFLFIEIALEAVSPTVVAWARVLFGAVALGCLRAARQPVTRADWPMIAVLGLVWLGVPFVLFPLAQRSIDSSLAGMINGATPLFTVLIAVVWTRRLPASYQRVGLLVGFAGVVAVNWPAVQGADATTVGVALAVLAAVFYGVAFNIAPPLQARSGTLPVIWRAQLVALVALSGPAAVDRSGWGWSWSAWSALVALGVLSTGVAFAAFVTLIARVGATRGSVAVYFIPIVAIVVGVVFAAETVEVVSLVGTGLVLVGAWLTSRKEA
jgi:drug/metabolite transporter (DMT)-like permease